MTLHATDAEIQDRFAYFQDEALRSPVLISTDGRPKTVLMSYDEFVRLQANDRQVYDVENLPPRLEAALLEAVVPDDYDDR